MVIPLAFTYSLLRDTANYNANIYFLKSQQTCNIRAIYIMYIYCVCMYIYIYIYIYI